MRPSDILRELHEQQAAKRLAERNIETGMLIVAALTGAYSELLWLTKEDEKR